MARTRPNLGGVYANMDFPPYEYQEYPKHIKTGPYGKFEVANNAKEESEIRTRLNLHNITEAKIQEAEDIRLANPEQDMLVQKARELGVPFNKKWSVEKLKSVISAAEKAADDLPPEENTNGEVTAQVHINPHDQPPEEDYSDEAKDKLIAHAKSLGINASKLWGFPRLRREIQALETDQNK